MGIAAFTTWLITAAGGLYLFAVWLIEHDGSKSGGAASRLRVPVVFSHVTLAVAGLAVWVVYLYVDEIRLAWAAFFILLPVVLLGLTMLTRWIPVHRAANSHLDDTEPARRALAGVAAGLPAQSAAAGPADRNPVAGAPERTFVAGPPERNFPVPVVVLHGIFAVITFILVTLTAVGAAPS
jgi:hypothetical protein